MLHYKTLFKLKCSDFRTKLCLIFLLNFLLSYHLLTSSCLSLVFPLTACPLPIVLLLSAKDTETLHIPSTLLSVYVCSLFTAIGLQMSLDCLEKRFWAITKQVTHTHLLQFHLNNL